MVHAAYRAPSAPPPQMPEGSICCNVEASTGDCGTLARSSGDYVTIISHGDDDKTRLRLPSGAKKTVPSGCRGMVGIVGGGGRLDKPVLKAGSSYHKYKAKRRGWPIVRGVVMNPVDHPHGGGNHQHMGKASTCARNAPPGKKCGKIGARRTGLVKGRPTVKDE